MWSLKSDTLLKGKRTELNKKAQKKTMRWAFWTHKNLFRREQFAQKTRLIDLQMDSVENSRHALSSFSHPGQLCATCFESHFFLIKKKIKLGQRVKILGDALIMITQQALEGTDISHPQMPGREPWNLPSVSITRHLGFSTEHRGWLMGVLGKCMPDESKWEVKI